jgi:hypothetical protein
MVADVTWEQPDTRPNNRQQVIAVTRMGTLLLGEYRRSVTRDDLITPNGRLPWCMIDKWTKPPKPE